MYMKWTFGLTKFFFYRCITSRVITSPYHTKSIKKFSHVSIMTRKEKVLATYLPTKEKEEMLNPKPVFSISASGRKTYRLAGQSAAGHNLSLIVNEEKAKKFGVPKQVASKSKPKKSCQEKFDDCEAKASAKKGGRGKKKVALEEKVDDLEEAAEEVKKEAKKAVKTSKTARGKKAAKEVVEKAEEVEEMAEEMAEAVEEVKEASPKKAPAKKPGRKPAAKKGGKKPAAKKTAKK
jgi:hypothetical protein